MTPGLERSLEEVNGQFTTVFLSRKPHLEKPGGLHFQFSSVAQLCPTLCDPTNHGKPDLSVHHQMPESTQIHVNYVGDAIQTSHPLQYPSPPVFNLSQESGIIIGSGIMYVKLQPCSWRIL